MPYLSLGNSPKPVFGEPDLNEFVQKTTAALIQGEETKKYQFVIEQINADWAYPFPIHKEDPSQDYLKPAVLPQYTGYLMMGNRRFAVLDGSEYTIGEILQENGYEIVNIHPTHVTIKGKQGNLIEIPLVEMF
jgi:hypothetical protein